MPDYLYHPTRRTAAYAWTATGTPLDAAAVVAPVVPVTPPRPQLPLSRAAAFACLLSATPLDAGLTPIAPSVTGLTRGIANRAAYALMAASPRDTGVVVAAPPIAPSYPDRSWATFRRSSFAPSVTPSPVDAGATMAGWLYHRAITDSTGGSLAGVVCVLTLTSANFDFPFANADGSDLRVYDETAGAVLPLWLLDYDPVAQTATVYYKATLTSHAHSLYYGNATAPAVSNFAGVFTHGTGFDSGWGDLTTNTSGSTASATRFAKPTSTSDSRNYLFWRLAESPTLSLSDLTAAGVTAGNYTGIREFNLIRDTGNRVLSIGGNYYATFSRRPNNSTDTIDAWIAHSTSKSGPWTGFAQMWTPGAVHLDYPSSVLRVGSTYYCFTTYGWTVGGGSTPGLVVKLRTSTDLVTWTDQSTVLSPGSFNDITSGACTDIGNPWVCPLADGTYMMTVEGYNTTNGVWSCYGATCSGPPFTSWTALNSGNALVSKGMTGTWDANGAANPKIFQMPDASFVIEYNGSDDVTNLDWQLGFASASSAAGPYTKNINNPIAGHTTGTYGCETAHLSWDENGTDYYHVCQRFDTTSNTAHAFLLYQEQRQGGLILLRATDLTDAVIAGRVLDAGNFKASTRSTFLAHRSLTPSFFIIAVQDSATVPTPTTAASWAAGRRLEISRSGHDAATPGDIQIVYWDTGAVRHFWTGSAWTTTTTFLATEHSRELVASIADDGTNYILSAQYADDGSSIGSATIAKTSVGTFANGRCLYMGDPFTNAGGTAGTFVRYVMVRPYAATEPVLSLGAGPPPSVAPLLPIFARARPSQAPYSLTVTVPLDAGIVVTAPALAPSLPDRVPPRLNQAPYSLFVTAPLDVAAVQPIAFPTTVDRATAARRTAPAAYSIATSTPLDAGIILAAPAIAPARPDRPLARPSQAPYSLVVPAPHDVGLAQPIIPAVMPAFARGPRWAAQSSYTALVSPPPLTPGDLQAFPDPFGSTVAASTDPFGSTVIGTIDPFASTVKFKGN